MSPSPEELRRQIQSLAFGQGFCACGIAPAEPLPEDARAIARWVEQGRNASLEYMARHADKREDIRRMVPGARSIICLVHSYLTDTSETVSRQTGVAKYALGEDYPHGAQGQDAPPVHGTEKNRRRVFLPGVHRFGSGGRTPSGPTRRTGLDREKYPAHPAEGGLVRVPVGDRYRPSASARRSVPRFALRSLPTLSDGLPYRSYRRQGTIDARKCLSYATIESRDDLPEDLAEKLGGRVFGCDACLDACPWNRHAERTEEPRLQPLSALASLQKSQWLTLDEATFRQVFTASPLRRAGWEKIRRTAEKALKK